MEITWYGHSCFKITENNYATVVTDPFDHHFIGYSALNLKADIVTISHDTPGHNYLPAVMGNPFTINGPGEYELGNVFITGIQTTRTNGKQGNTLYAFNYDGISIVHLGNMNRQPEQSEIEALGPVHIALVPVGGAEGLNASSAAEAISVLEPNIVIPMHYATHGSTSELEPINKFLKEMGLTEIETLTSLKINKNASFSEETQVVVLERPVE